MERNARKRVHKFKKKMLKGKDNAIRNSNKSSN